MRNMKSNLKYSVLIFAFAFINAVKFRCDYSHTDFGYFKYHEIPTTWFDARLQCQLEGGMLASPTTAAIKNIMLQSLCKSEIFTGIHSTFSKGQYYSIDGIPLDQIPHEWALYEPDNKYNAESCLALRSDGKFADVNCLEPRPYICYKEHSNIDVNICGTPDPEYRFDTKRNKCYKFHTNPRTFERAHFACSAEGGHLAIIKSEEEAKAISEIFAKYPASEILGNFNKDIAFVGFPNWGESDEWTTIHGQSIQDVGYAKFDKGQPDNTTTGEYCGTVNRNALLNYALCNSHLAFICEKKTDYPPVCDVNESKQIPLCNIYIQNQVKLPQPYNQWSEYV